MPEPGMGANNDHSVGGSDRGTDRPDDNDRGGSREEKESFDRAMDNANRPDRAPAPESTAVDDDDDRPKTDKPDDRQDRAAGPPGIGAPPGSPSPADTPATTNDEDEGGVTDRGGGFFGGLTETLSAPPTDAEGNRRSMSPVADRLNNTRNYSFDDIFGPPALEDPGLTSGQSAALAETAAVMNGYAIGPTIPSTADLTLGGIMPGAPGPLSARPVDQKLSEKPSFVDTMYNGAAYGAGIVVGAGERALGLASELPGAAWEGVNMVNDAAGTVLDTAVGWTGIDLFAGHAQRNAARGQAMVDGVIVVTRIQSAPSSCPDLDCKAMKSFDNFSNGL